MNDNINMDSAIAWSIVIRLLYMKVEYDGYNTYTHMGQQIFKYLLGTSFIIYWLDVEFIVITEHIS